MEQIVNIISEALGQDFVLNALAVGSLLSISCALLGLFLVLRRFALIGDGLAHVSFASAALALALSASPLWITIPVTVAASLLIMKLNEKAVVHGDAAIGLISSTSVAAGALIASVSGGFNTDLMSTLFGSILILSRTDVLLSIILSLSVIALIIFSYPALFAITADEEYARVIGIKVRTYNTLMIILTAVTIALGIRIVGTMLISSLIIFPAVTALQVSRSFKSTLLIASAVSVTCMVMGVLLSYMLNLPTGSVIVALNALMFTAFFAAGRLSR